MAHGVVRPAAQRHFGQDVAVVRTRQCDQALAGAAREGRPVVPKERPSVNVAVYEAGRCTWYGLVELPPSSSSWTGAAADGVVDSWRYPSWAAAAAETRGWQGEWLEASVILEIPDAIKAYQVDLAAVGPVQVRVAEHPERRPVSRRRCAADVRLLDRRLDGEDATGLGSEIRAPRFDAA